jgi:glycosyltransferase involved in cell wall biosynthesis
MPTVSIIIPCYNQGHYLGEAIESCLRQTDQDFEIIVVDDGSTDNTPHVVKQFPQVRYISQPHSGPGCARNMGFRYAAGKYIQFLDADDVLLPTKLQCSADILDQDPQVHAVYTELECRTPDLTKTVPIKRYPLPIPQDRLLPEFLLGKGLSLLVFSMLIRREWVEKIGGFDETLRSVEDWDFVVRLALQGICLRFVNEPLCWYRQIPGSLSRNETQQAYWLLEASKKLWTLPIPTEINVSRLVANRHDVYARQLWNVGRRAEAREQFREAIRLDNQRRAGRRALILMTYVLSHRSAQNVISRLHRLKP